MSLNQSMNISVESMKNYQYALTVVSQNISNMDVDGYVRQRADFQTKAYTSDCSNVISTIKGMNGAYIASLSDFIDDAAVNDALNSNTDAQYYNTLSDELAGIEDIIDSLGDEGLNSLLNDFYTKATNLEQFPTDINIREQYVSAAQTLCEKFNKISKDLQEVKTETTEKTSNNFDKVNTLLDELATANLEYLQNNKSSQSESNRNSILSELSNYMDVVTDKNPNGTINLYVDGIKVVQGSDVNYTVKSVVNEDGTFSVSLVSTTDPTYSISTGVIDSFQNGSIGAQLDFLYENESSDIISLKEIQSYLDNAANKFATRINEIQTYDDGTNFAANIKYVDGVGTLEKSTEAMFVSNNGKAIDATNISVNSAIATNAYLVAAARINLDDYTTIDTEGNPQVSTDWINAIGNSDNATIITGTQNEKLCDYGGATNNVTLSQLFTYIGAKAGTDTNNIGNKASAYQDIADSASDYVSNLTGVNLDEELADMIKYQRSYEASATLFSTINGLYDYIINMV